MNAVSDPTWTKAATTGLSSPDATSTIPARSTVTVPMKLNVTIRCARRAVRRVVTRSRGSELTRITSELSLAMSVPPSHGDSHVSFRQRRGVIDPVADHHQPVACGPFAVDHSGLVLGEQVGANVGDAHRPADGEGRPGGVAGDHDGAHAFVVQVGDSLGGGRPDFVGEQYRTGVPAVDADVYRVPEAGVDEGVVQQSDGAVEQGDPPADQCRGDLP